MSRMVPLPRWLRAWRNRQGELAAARSAELEPGSRVNWGGGGRPAEAGRAQGGRRGARLASYTHTTASAGRGSLQKRVDEGMRERRRLMSQSRVSASCLLALAHSASVRCWERLSLWGLLRAELWPRWSVIAPKTRQERGKEATMNHKKMIEDTEWGFPSFFTLSHQTREPGSRVSGSG